MRIPSLLAALAIATAGTAQAQNAATPPDTAAPALGTGRGNGIINPVGNAASSINASGTVRLVPMSDLAKGANSFTEEQARTRIAGAGFSAVTPLTKDGNGIWRGRGGREGRTFDVGFDYKGEVAFQ